MCIKTTKYLDHTNILSRKICKWQFWTVREQEKHRVIQEIQEILLTSFAVERFSYWQLQTIWNRHWNAQYSLKKCTLTSGVHVVN